MSNAANIKSVQLSLNPHNQNIETLNRIVASILGRAGCNACGRVAFLHVHFQGDPGQALTKDGVISLQTEAF